jgi:hypothetical protein
MKRVSSAAVVDDDRFNDDVIHVSSLLETDFSDEDCESSENEHLSDHFFLNLAHVRFSF